MLHILLVILFINTCILYSYLPLSIFTIYIFIQIYYSFSFSNTLIYKYITKLYRPIYMLFYICLFYRFKCTLITFFSMKVRYQNSVSILGRRVCACVCNSAFSKNSSECRNKNITIYKQAQKMPHRKDKTWISYVVKQKS